MLSAFTFSLAVGFFSIFDSVYTENQNETSQIQNDNDFADSSDSFSGNITANFSIPNSDLDNKILNFGGEKLQSNFSITDRSGNQESILPNHQEKAIEFNTKNITIESKKFDDFRPSPQLETFYEYNKFPVKPVLPEPKMVRNYATVTSEVEALPIENDRQTPRNLNHFEPGYSAFGSRNFQDSGRVQNVESSRNTGDSNNGPPWIKQHGSNEVNRKNENGDTPWLSRVRFPQTPITNENPYPFVPNTGRNQNINTNNGLSPPKNNEYLPPSEGYNRYFPSTNNDQGAAKTNFNNINTNNVGYLPPSTTYGYAGEGNIDIRNRYSPTNYGASGANEEYNFNKLVEVPKRYFSDAPNKYSPHQNTYETPYNIMEKPLENHDKTFGGGLSHNPWKKILKLLATFIPIGLLISALTPTVITVTNVNSTGDMPATRYRSTDDPKKELTSHILSSLDYFDKLNENGCEYRVFCELLVSASHMPNSKQHVENLLNNFAKQMCDEVTSRTTQDSYLTELSYQLRQMAHEALDDATYGGSGLDLNLMQYKKNIADAVHFTVGAHLCEKFLYGSIGLDEFCSEMFNEHLEKFLIDIPHISKEVLLNYGLIEDGDLGVGREGEEEKENKSSYVCCGGGDGDSNGPLINDWCSRCLQQTNLL